MDILFWIILIVVIAAVIWWLLNRNKSANAPGASGTRSDGALEGGSAAASADAAATTGIPTAAGFGAAAGPAAPATAEEPADSSASPRATPPTAEALDTPVRDSSGAGDGTDSSRAGDERRRQDEAEWATQWSEAGPSGSRPAPASTGPAPATAAAPVAAAPTAGAAPGETDTAQPASVEHDSPTPVHPRHHDEYTAPHAPTLPGAETAAVEETAAAEMMARAESSALVEEAGAQYQELAPLQGEAAGEPTGHLAADEPYGAGSASPAADGSGPADYSVKADAAAMVYYEEGHPDYEQTRAEVWFESAAHAEAAGFRAPRRRRLQQEDGPL